MDPRSPMTFQQWLSSRTNPGGDSGNWETSFPTTMTVSVPPTTSCPAGYTYYEPERRCIPLNDPGYVGNGTETVAWNVALPGSGAKPFTGNMRTDPGAQTGDPYTSFPTTMTVNVPQSSAPQWSTDSQTRTIDVPMPSCPAGYYQSGRRCINSTTGAVYTG